MDFDCKTSDASAKVTLWKRKELGVVTNIPEGNRVKLNGQVFSIYNLTLSDGGLFYCKASDSNGQKIQEDIGLLFISQGKILITFDLFTLIFGVEYQCYNVRVMCK